MSVETLLTIGRRIGGEATADGHMRFPAAR
jgi:hypothetical protein